MSLIEICNHRKITVNPDDISYMTIDKAYGHPTRLLIRFRTGRELVVTTEHQQPAIDAEQVYAKLLLAATQGVCVDERIKATPSAAEQKIGLHAFIGDTDKSAYDALGRMAVGVLRGLAEREFIKPTTSR